MVIAYKNMPMEVCKSTYAENGNTAIELVLLDADGYVDELYATLTINALKMPPQFALIDVNNHPWVEDVIRESKIGEPTGQMVRVGMCKYPMYRLNLEKIGG